MSAGSDRRGRNDFAGHRLAGTPGERLYRLLHDDPEGVTDTARYFPAMNPAVKQHWEDLAQQIIDRPARTREQLAGDPS